MWHTPVCQVTFYVAHSCMSGDLCVTLLYVWRPMWHTPVCRVTYVSHSCMSGDQCGHSCLSGDLCGTILYVWWLMWYTPVCQVTFYVAHSCRFGTFHTAHLPVCRVALLWSCHKTEAVSDTDNLAHAAATTVVILCSKFCWHRKEGGSLLWVLADSQGAQQEWAQVQHTQVTCKYNIISGYWLTGKELSKNGLRSSTHRSPANITPSLGTGWLAGSSASHSVSDWVLQIFSVVLWVINAS